MRDIPEEAKTDLRLFLAKVKGDIQSLERKVHRNQEAYLAAEGRAEILQAKLRTLEERYRAACRELAIGAGASPMDSACSCPQLPPKTQGVYLWLRNASRSPLSALA